MKEEAQELIDSVNDDRLADADAMRLKAIERRLNEIKGFADTTLAQAERAVEARKQLRLIVAKPAYADQKEDVRAALTEIERGDRDARKYIRLIVTGNVMAFIDNEASEYLKYVDDDHYKTYAL